MYMYMEIGDDVPSPRPTAANFIQSVYFRHAYHMNSPQLHL